MACPLVSCSGCVHTHHQTVVYPLGLATASADPTASASAASASAAPTGEECDQVSQVTRVLNCVRHTLVRHTPNQDELLDPQVLQQVVDVGAGGQHSNAA